MVTILSISFQYVCLMIYKYCFSLCRLSGKGQFGHLTSLLAQQRFLILLDIAFHGVESELVYQYEQIIIFLFVCREIKETQVQRVYLVLLGLQVMKAQWVLLAVLGKWAQL